MPGDKSYECEKYVILFQNDQIIGLCEANRTTKDIEKKQNKTG